MKTLKLLKKLNLIFSIIIVVIAIYILIYPLIPEIAFRMSANKFQGYAYQSTKTIEVLQEEAKELPPIPEDNRLVIPKIYVNAPIVDGEDESVLDFGMWRIPNTSTPDKGGNTVIAGHRTLYTSGPDTLYNLDKIEINDLLLVYWQGKEYVYKVYDITEVSSESMEILDNTIDSRITLFSCTPKWTSEQRLVVKATLQQ